MCLLSIPNINNNLIDNATSQLTLRLQSNGDRCFMFFTAFNLEVSIPETNPIVENDNLISSANNLNKEKVSSSSTLIKEIPAGNEMVADASKTYSSNSSKNLALKKQARSLDKKAKSAEAIEIRTLSVSNYNISLSFVIHPYF